MLLLLLNWYVDCNNLLILVKMNTKQYFIVSNIHSTEVKKIHVECLSSVQWLAARILIKSLCGHNFAIYCAFSKLRTSHRGFHFRFFPNSLYSKTVIVFYLQIGFDSKFSRFIIIGCTDWIMHYFNNGYLICALFY